MSEEEYEFWFDKDLSFSDFIESEGNNDKNN